MRVVNACFFFNDTATTEIYTLSLHDALPIWPAVVGAAGEREGERQPGGAAVPGEVVALDRVDAGAAVDHVARRVLRSEEHTSELQSRQYLVCRLLLEKKKINDIVDVVTDIRL